MPTYCHKHSSAINIPVLLREIRQYNEKQTLKLHHLKNDILMFRYRFTKALTQIVKLRNYFLL